jgi:ATP-dependent RNA helicase SUPV3L1/SUV3
MNLPIRRVVFLEEEKFDGEQKRPLLPQEVRQIAGRAGRYGKYDIGFYTTTGDVEELAATYNAASEQIKDAVIGLPREILGFDARISRILSRWAQIPVEEGYIKMSVEREIKLAERLETMSDNKDRIYDFVNFKFDEEEPAVLFLWEECFVRVLDGENLEDVDIEYYADESTMAGLELIYREYDLLYNCVRYVNPVSPRLEEIQQRRREITNKLMKLLEEQGFEGRKCKRCGRSLPMGYRYGVCEQCFDRRRRGGHRSRR